MPDFRSLRYLTSPNMVVSDSANHSPGIQNGGPFLMMNPFSSRCCQHNHSQGWPYYVENLCAATPDNGLVALLYNTCSVKAKVGDGTEIILNEETHYPFDDKISFTVNAEKSVRFPLYLRIPDWCKGAKIHVNGQEVSVTSQPDAYIKIDRAWQNGDKVTLELPMQIQLKTWNENKNSVSVNYRPLTFSLKIEEVYKKIDSRKSAIGDSKWQKDADPEKWPSYEIFSGSDWNYGLLLDQKNPVQNFKITKKPWPKDDYPFSQASVPLEITTTGKKIPDWGIDEYGLCAVLPQSPVETAQPAEQISMVPMGAARLRISAFPVVE